MRERARLLAPDFTEVAPLAGGGDPFVPANFVLGCGKCDGRWVVVGGEDFTIHGGSPNLAGLRKSRYCEQLALEMKCPLVRLVEGVGGSPAGAKGSSSGGSKASGRKPQGEPVYDPHRFLSVARCHDTLPVASIVFGTVAGLPAVRAAASHFVVMLESALLVVAGPRVVEHARGLPAGTLERAAVGGAQVHLAAGLLDRVAATDSDAIAEVRRFLGYLPPSVGARPPRAAGHAGPGGSQEKLRGIVADLKRAFDVREVLRTVLDAGSFFELRPGWAKSVVIGLGRLGGETVGVVANDCREQGGAMSAAATRKITHCGKLCAQFHIPWVHFVDEPGFMIGAEDEATLGAGASAAHFVATLPIPTATVLLRRCFGVATYCHIGASPYVIAWPTSRSGPMPVEVGVELAFKRQLREAEDPAALRATLLAAAESRLSPWAAAESFAIHDLIDPADTRSKLLGWLDRVEPQLEALQPRSRL